MKIENAAKEYKVHCLENSKGDRSDELLGPE